MPPQILQAPIKVFGVEGRYAHALFSAASQRNVIEKVEKELTDFQVSLSLFLSLLLYSYTYMYIPTLLCDIVL